MDHRLVVGQARGRCAEGVLHSRESARRTRRCELRPLPAEHHDTSQGDQGRLAPLRAQLLPPLPAGRSPRAASRYLDQSRRFSVCHQSREDKMKNDGNESERAIKTTDQPFNRRKILLGGTTLAAASAIGSGAPVTVAQAQAQPAPSGQRPNIVFIMGDDIGWFNIGAYHQGIMASRTPNLDKLASEGMRFTDYYAEASCTAGRANFITGELPIRTGLTTVGQAGADVGMPDQAPTIATVLRSIGYATGQFGKNHLGDLNKYLPTLHGFDEFFGYLYHLDAMEDPAHRNYPQALKDRIGPRNMLHTWASDTDDQTVQPRWGKIGKQRIVDEGPLPPNPVQ